MTSSLVGSEMCIRDSYLAGLPLDLAEVKSQLKKAYRRLRSQLARSFKAVSYTHLTLPTICSV
eukprot:10368410-Prorocentrum_lima.AAC.1